jgi:hypothetical protein
MTDDVHIYTKTMARIYAEQGHLEKSVQIYRYLLEQSPERQDLRDELFEMEGRIAEGDKIAGTDLAHVFSNWIEAMGTMNRLRKLRKIQKRLKSISRSNGSE